MAAHQRGQNGDLAAGVPAVHVVAGVLGLGIAQLLGDLEGLGKAHVLPGHLGQHKVGGAVDDALHPGDDVGRQALVHGGDNGGAAPHRRLEQERAVVALGQGQQLGAVGGHHLLVGGADAAAALQGLPHIGVGKAGAADGLHHHPDLGVGEDDVDVLDKEVCVRPVRKIPDVQDVFHFHRLAGPAGNARRVPVQDLIYAAAHGAKA